MSLEQLLSDWGLPAILAGTILEGDAVAFLGGVLAHRRLVPFEAAALAATAGAFIVDQVVFQIGRHVARFPRARRVLEARAARRILGWIDRRPGLMCAGFRFLYGMKTIGALAIGASSVTLARFALFDLLGCAVWAHVLTALGYGAGQAIERLFGRLAVHHHLGLALGLGLAALAALALWQHRSGGDLP
ncbi:MAG: VTT domain-containing protein [Rhodobacteraceae bacterium]|nr:VTT domain-containing protein [Paracoccaceae bacterium]